MHTDLTTFWDESEHGLSDLTFDALRELRDQVNDAIEVRLGHREREYQVRITAATVAADDLHLGRAGWQTDGDIVSNVAEKLGPLEPEEANKAVEAYDTILATFEVGRF